MTSSWASYTIIDNGNEVIIYHLWKNTYNIYYILNILDKIWQLIEPHCSFNKNTFQRTIKFILEKSYFTFNNSFYLQTFGVPISSPISPILVLLVMNDILDGILPQLLFQLPSIHKYVDDLITSVPVDMTQRTSWHLRFI